VITINSATLVNKGLELLEAGLLYGVDLDAIQVVVHPQSIVHSMVEFCDGSTIAQCSPPDMRLPIALGLSWPDRVDQVAPPCDWSQATAWTFEPLDEDVFAAVRLAREAVAASATHPAVYNAANEECVEAFLAGRIGFLDIVTTVERVLAEHDGTAPDALTLDAVLAAEVWARARAQEILSRV
jgi:1-deoxy-D-xylulose-5-phosphate reductoisomerase